MRHATVVLSLALALLFTGCVMNSGPSPELAIALNDQNDCVTRFHAAEKISDTRDRDLAFSKIASSAVTCRDDATLMNCITNISDPDLRDDTAAGCAVSLAKVGRGTEAGTVANAINNPTTRIRTLVTINQTTPDTRDNGK